MRANVRCVWVAFVCCRVLRVIVCLSSLCVGSGVRACVLSVVEIWWTHTRLRPLRLRRPCSTCTRNWDSVNIICHNHSILTVFSADFVRAARATIPGRRLSTGTGRRRR